MVLVRLHGDAVDDDVVRILVPSHASPARAREAATHYSSGEWTLYAWTDGEAVVARIGFERDDEIAHVRSLAVAPSHQGRGVGRAMAEAALAALGASWVEAETDADAVGFYRRLGFTTVSLGEEYPGVERFRCVRAAFTEARRRRQEAGPSA
jgi:ribosomal protein S18 acetylase RimI-like enzyme